ncbi:PEP-CTERM sorting domain-containing protein [Lentisalinibacter salinarum]|uniref:PEP-CTERM sorting domain-containing protein n=1 Tax=Lentisalinibacter salinarum TaxID=2992239 RepID=UPI00386E77DF
MSDSSSDCVTAIKGLELGSLTLNVEFFMGMYSSIYDDADPFFLDTDPNGPESSPAAILAINEVLSSTGQTAITDIGLFGNGYFIPTYLQDGFGVPTPSDDADDRVGGRAGVFNGDWVVSSFETSIHYDTNLGLPDSAFSFAKFTSVSVPEPGTLSLFGISLAGMGLARRRKKA